jgi:hypothetical protein
MVRVSTTFGKDPTYARGVRDGSVVVRSCHTRSRAQVRILGRLMVLFIPDSHLSEDNAPSLVPPESYKYYDDLCTVLYL